MHAHRAHGETDMRIVFLDPTLSALLPERPAVFLASDLAREVLLALTDSSEGDDHAGVPGRRGPARARLLRVLIDELDEAREQPLHLPEPQDDRLKAITRMLREDPANSTPLADIGKAIGVSARTFSRLFRSELGMTFYEWRTQLRVYHALLFLAEGMDVTQIAYACGWSNPSGFIAAFTSMLGTTPGRYRTSQQSTESAPIGPSGPGAITELA